MTSLPLMINQFKTLPTSQGTWISFEGIEGCGKSTQIKLLTDLLTHKGYEVLTVREPGGTVIGEELRQVILHNKNELHYLSETFIFMASRCELLNQKILPWLNSPKKIVLMDRYLDSTLVYQGWAKTKNFEDMLKLHQFAPLNHLPHHTFLLEISPELSLKRQEVRNQKKDYFESKGVTFLEMLADGYKELKNLFPQRIHCIDGSQEINFIQNEMIKKLNLV